MKKSIIAAIALASVLAVNVCAHAGDETPYCTAANTHTHWWTWTKSTMEAACYTAMLKTFKSGNSINALHQGWYKPNSLNKAILRCQEGKKKVIGNGSEVFTNAANMRVQLGWHKSCVVIVK